MEYLGSALILGLVDGSVIIHRPEALQFLFGQHVSIVLIKHVYGLFAANLKYKVTFSVDVVGGNSARRRQKDNRILGAHLVLQITSQQCLNLVNGLVEKDTVAWVHLGSSDHDPCLRISHTVDQCTR